MSLLRGESVEIEDAARCPYEDIGRNRYWLGAQALEPFLHRIRSDSRDGYPNALTAAFGRMGRSGSAGQERWRTRFAGPPALVP